jgi:hypothetical protein
MVLAVADVDAADVELPFAVDPEYNWIVEAVRYEVELTLVFALHVTDSIVASAGTSDTSNVYEICDSALEPVVHVIYAYELSDEPEYPFEIG